MLFILPAILTTAARNTLDADAP
ncbi:unnamed protein product, partial [Rotaria socialis]